jgi:hypothetical protein
VLPKQTKTKFKGSKRAETIFEKKNRLEGLNFKNHHKATVIKTVFEIL